MILVPDRLISPFEVNDAEPSHAQEDPIPGPRAAAVRPPVTQKVERAFARRNQARWRIEAQPQLSIDSAHGLPRRVIVARRIPKTNCRGYTGPWVTADHRYRAHPQAANDTVPAKTTPIPTGTAA